MTVKIILIILLIQAHGRWLHRSQFLSLLLEQYYLCITLIIGFLLLVHTLEVQKGLKIGMVLFIASEVMLFVAFFWSYFHVSLNLPGHHDFQWPPKGIIPFDPLHLPYLNTLILLLSGTTLTWAHHELLEGDFSKVSKALLVTVVLGGTFSLVQGFEYAHAAFGFKDGVYPSNFYMATGFHGAHVLIGTIFLLVCLIRNNRREFKSNHHVGFEAAAWYWHFVDVVWLFLFVAIYWYGYRE